MSTTALNVNNISLNLLRIGVGLQLNVYGVERTSIASAMDYSSTSTDLRILWLLSASDYFLGGVLILQWCKIRRSRLTLRSSLTNFQRSLPKFARTQ
jgi:hypothetical protein